MIDYIVYTRCSPRLDIINGGKVVAMEGYGVSECSTGFLSHPSLKLNYIDFVLKATNCMADDEYVYSYNKVSNGEYLLAADTTRTTAERRPNGMAHRPHTFIKEALLGDFDFYPCDLFDTSYWKSLAKGQNDYYRMDADKNPSAQYAPVVNPASSLTSILDAAISFSIGKEALLKKAVSYIIGELMKNEGDRRPLFIKDTKENILLWIACIEYSLPLYLAKEITFLTNKKTLGNPINNKLYYIENGPLIADYNSFSNVQVSKHLHELLIGVAAPNVAIPSMPNNMFEVLDGKMKTITVKQTKYENSDYVDEVVNNRKGSDIADYFNILSDNKVSIKEDIVDLYESVKYVLYDGNPASLWNYQSALKHIQRLVNTGIASKPSFKTFIANSVIANYARFFVEDCDNSYALKKLIERLEPSSSSSFASAIQNVSSQKASCFTSRPGELITLWKVMKSLPEVSILLPYVQNLFSQANEASTVSAMLGFQKEDFTGTLNMMSDICSETTHKKFFLEPRYMNFINKILFTGRSKREIVDMTLSFVLKDPEADRNYIPNLSKAAYALTDKTYYAAIWDSYARIKRLNTVEKISKMAEYNPLIDAESIEKVLVKEVESGGMSKEIRACYEKHVERKSKDPSTGYELLLAWSNNTKGEEDFKEMLLFLNSYIRRSRCSMDAVKPIMEKIDGHFAGIILKGEEKLDMRAIKQLSMDTKYAFSCLNIKEIEEELARRSRPEDQVRALEKYNQGKPIIIESSALESNWFEKLISLIKRVTPSLHIALIASFEVDGKIASKSTVNTYMEKLFEIGKRDDLETFVSLCQVVKGKETKEVTKIGIIDVIKANFESEITNYAKEAYSKDYEKKVMRLSLEKDVEEYVLKLLEDYGENDTPSKSGGFKFFDFFKSNRR